MATCTNIEKCSRVSESARSGDTCRVALRGIRPEQAERGLVLARPGSITARTGLEAEVYFPSQEEGGRGTAVENGHRSQIHFRTAEVTGTIESKTPAPLRVEGRAGGGTPGRSTGLATSYS
ncbi:hypothetical protein [Streptomyces sp. CFMR 7]|uniref:EF-Tu C-terminal domain-related protein n=1 Tax=Streptomyces sp. CFMR 7 TaxID=1649184 RepID=UPI00164351C6|nr:hypothetical protein [Streptomyces sp. CFMR 7]